MFHNTLYLLGFFLLGQVHRNAQPQLVVAVQSRSVDIDRHFVQKWTNIKMEFCSEILEPTEVFYVFFIAAV
jgi:hypothetical protein